MSRFSKIHKVLLVYTFDLFLDICLLRKGPQDVPPSAALLKACLLSYSLSGLLLLLLSIQLPMALLQVFLDLLLLSSLLHLALLTCKRRARFVQTLSAITGTGTILTLFAMPLMVWLNAQPPDNAPLLAALLLLGLMLWSIAVMAHILRCAFETSIAFSTLCAVAYNFLSWVLIGWIGSDGSW